MRRLLLATSSLVAALAVAAGPAAASIAINFDALQNDELVNGFYDGGFGSLGSGPGPNDGITFTNALVLNADENNEGLLVTPPNTITFTGLEPERSWTIRLALPLGSRSIILPMPTREP